MRIVRPKTKEKTPRRQPCFFADGKRQNVKILSAAIMPLTFGGYDGTIKYNEEDRLGFSGEFKLKFTPVGVGALDDPYIQLREIISFA